MQTYIAQNKFLQTLIRKFTKLKKSFQQRIIYKRIAESVIRNFENDTIESVEDDYIIPTRIFDISKPVVIVKVPFCTKNEVCSKQFIQKFHNFTGSNFDLRIKKITGKTKTL